MKAEHADLRGQKSFCYAPFDQAETTFSCLAEIRVIVSSLTSVGECAGPEHHGFHAGTFVWSRASFHHTFFDQADETKGFHRHDRSIVQDHSLG